MGETEEELFWSNATHSLLFVNASTAVVAAVVFVSVYLFLLTQRNYGAFSNFPPGPKPWPVVGNFAFLLIPDWVLRKINAGDDEGEITKKKVKHPVILSPHVMLTDLAKIYGNIYSIFFGNRPMVILNGYETVRDALVNHAEEFSDRPTIPTITIITKKKGKVT